MVQSVNRPSVSCVEESPTLGALTYAHARPCPWVLGGHGCDIIGNIIGNVTNFEYMDAI